MLKSPRRGCVRRPSSIHRLHTPPRRRPRSARGTQRLLLDEPERRAQLRVDRCGAPVRPDSVPDVLPERVRRDRAVGVQSEQALVECDANPANSSRSTGTPLGRAAHRDVELVGEPAAEHVGPIEQRLDHAERLGRRVIAVQDSSLTSTTASLLITARGDAASPSATATATVCSKISSSLTPASFTACTSASVIV